MLLELRGRYSCQIICQQEQREAFDIHKYGSKVIEGMQRNQQIPFRRIVCGKPIFQICRLSIILPKTSTDPLIYSPGRHVQVIVVGGKVQDGVIRCICHDAVSLPNAIKGR